MKWVIFSMSRFSPFVFVKHGVCAGAYNRVFVHCVHIHIYIETDNDINF